MMWGCRHHANAGNRQPGRLALSPYSRTTPLSAKPASDIRPGMRKSLPTHEQAKMSAWCHGLLDRVRLTADQMLCRKYLPGSNDVIIPCGKQKQRAAKLGQIDSAAKRHETAGGEAVLLEQMFDDLQIVDPQQAER